MNQDKLTEWANFFDKRQASPVPSKFPVRIKRVPEQLELEDIDEEPTDEVIDGLGRLKTLSQDSSSWKKSTNVVRYKCSAHTIKNEAKKEPAIPVCRNTKQIGGQIKDPVLNKPPHQETPVTTATNSTSDEPIRIDSAHSSTDSDGVSYEIIVNEDVKLKINETSDTESSGFESDESNVEETTVIPPKSEPSRITTFDFPIIEELKTGKVLNLIEAKELKKLIFGDSLCTFSELWTSEFISFKNRSPYEVNFFKDGPTALLACIQAYFLKNYLFRKTNPCSLSNNDKVHSMDRCLSLSIADILWKAGGNQGGKVALCSNSKNFCADLTYKEDGVTEKVRVFDFSEKEALNCFCFKYLDHIRNKLGCILLIYSIILSRTLTKITEELGDDSFLLNENEKSSQSFINLLLTGKAVSNCFNGQQEIKDNKTGKTKLIQGIPERSEIGFLHLKEVQNSIKYEVGSRLKTPLYPIWIVLNNGQFSVMHSKRKDLLNDWKLERRFDLYCTVEKSRHIDIQQEIRLTVDTVTSLLPPEEDEEEDEGSSLESILRTKWCDAVINWNGNKRF